MSTTGLKARPPYREQRQREIRSLILLPVRPAVVALTGRAAGWASKQIVQGRAQDLGAPGREARHLGS